MICMRRRSKFLLPENWDPPPPRAVYVSDLSFWYVFAALLRIIISREALFLNEYSFSKALIAAVQYVLEDIGVLHVSRNLIQYL